MNTIDLISTIVLTAAAIWAIVRLSIQLRKLFVKSDIIITNTKTGKSVTIGKHPQKDLGKLLLEVID